MSVQTHTSSLPPPQGGLGARISWLFARLLSNPNPVWIRELRQSARLTRTPVILAAITSTMTLLIASIGGVLSATSEPAQVGIGVFHTFFSLAFAVVTWVGPAVAAATIASERSGRTWETLLLTGLSPAAIARGKFLAALTYVALYIVMLAPVGGLSFLFGGVTPAEVVLAFALLLLIAGLSVAFGLAVSSKLSSPSVSILVTLLVAVPLSIVVYTAGGVGLSLVARDQWPGITGGAPVWLPTAYVRADFSLAYLVFLVLFPLIAAVVPAWLFYEVTIANMASASDDRSTRLRVWLLACGPLLGIANVLAALAMTKSEWCFAGQITCWLFSLFGAFLVAGEPLGPSLRVETHWGRAHASALRRAVGPGVGRAAGAVVLLTLVCQTAVTAVGVLLARSRDDRLALLGFGAYAIGFSLFCVGFAAWARSRTSAGSLPRVLLISATLLALLGPYIAMAIGGMFAEDNLKMRLVAAPSPAFAFAAYERFQSPGGSAELYGLAGAGAALGWALIGLGLLALGATRARQRWARERAVAANPAPAAAPVANAAGA
ncbi:MAG TPA: ABC transporter permease [Polyangiaceae bacterium]|nr:ABC transporter permease [Polyangiaceae bacterium]